MSVNLVPRVSAPVHVPGSERERREEESSWERGYVFVDGLTHMILESIFVFYYVLGLPGIIVLIAATIAHDGYGTDSR